MWQGLAMEERVSSYVAGLAMEERVSSYVAGVSNGGEGK